MKRGRKKGYKCSEEIKRQMSEVRKGQIPWNKGKKGVQEYSEAYRRKMSKIKKGQRVSMENRLKLSLARRGSNGSNWRGGLTSKNETIRHGIEFRLWREAVFARDNWICQKSGERGGRLHPHHIQNFADYPELRFAIDNGITLSEKEHHIFHSKYGKKMNNKEQLTEFLSDRPAVKIE